jgi:ABC-type spermidine/putrescine transport system permease subunit I
MTSRRLERLFLVPPVAFVLVFLVYPLTTVVRQTFEGPGGTFSAYTSALQDEFFREAVVRTVVTCALVSVSTLVLALPIAYEVTRPRTSRVRALILGAVVLSLWLSVLVRTYTWLLLLQRTGVVNVSLQDAGLTSQPLDLVRNDLGVFIGMTHILLPFSVLSLVPAMRSVDPRLLDAAWSLGAGRLTTLRTVVLPLARNGIVAGGLLTFVLGLGFFVSPQILGDPSHPFVSQVIAEQITRRRDLTGGAAMSVMLALLSAVLYGAAVLVAGDRTRRTRTTDG